MLKQIIVLLAVLMAFACQSGSTHDQKQATENTITTADSTGVPVLTTSSNSLSKQLMLVRTAHVNAEVTSVKGYQQWLLPQLSGVGAYVASEFQNNATDAVNTTLTIKVPVQYFDMLLSLIETKTARLVEKQVTSNDVTSDYHDAKNRAQTQLHLKARYQALQQQATKMADILALQKEIDAIDEAYDVAKGTSKYLSAQATYSTIHLKLYEPIIVAENEPSVGAAFMEAVNDGWTVFEGIALLLVRLWPMLLIVGILLFVWKKNKQSHAKK
ncbi:MAG TPA: hypothetical protein DCL43_03040 [Chitinophagaceae bacterium]|nr:hypothetical protein [Chitinophagaceae bacterium]HAN38358.1 hypothetical protein [Chitinophagaceae bacterium]